MALFQQSVIKQYISRLDENKLQQGWNHFESYFKDNAQQKIINESKEEEFQVLFLTNLFDKCLGFNIDGINKNLFIEFKNVTSSEKADGAIKINDEVVAVIELKSTKTKDFKEIQKQAFGYQVSHPNCKYVVTSNFNKLRFYIENATAFEEFDLFNLTYERFKLLWLCLSFESVSSGVPLKIKSESTLNEENITKKLYKDYSLFRKEIFNDIVEKNQQYDKLTLFNKTQKLLDRFLFIFFAEDRRLLPVNSISKIIEKWEDDIAYGDEKSLYTSFKLYFNLLNKGRPASVKREEIFAYNGGLFAPDEILNSISIDDKLLSKHTKNLSTYDFESDVSVNILGHIFEHSLSEIEEIQNEITGIETDKTSSKRKKDGVFYTPSYITKYIVENTVGKLCQEKKEELEINEEVYTQRKARSKKRIDNLDTYRSWLLGITICDPACGSGAFLVQALDFLIEEHKYIDELNAAYHGASIPFSDITSSILENNLYGVDINGESVEIAKLSLWLRTAQKGRKLTSLNSNLKCGNSLIDDPEVAGNKAFNWENEFPEVFANGGFDVVIGNPPYVNIEKVDDKTKSFLFECYKTIKGRTDLYVAFTELIFKLINQSALTGIIIPYSVTKQNYAEDLRNQIINRYGLLQIVDTSDYFVFDDAVVKTVILVMSKEFNKGYTEIFKSKNPFSLTDSKHELPQKNFKLFNKTVFETKPVHNFLDLKKKIELKSIRLEDICLIAYGVRVNNKTDKTKPKSYYFSETKFNGYKKFVEGKDIHRYSFSQTGFLNYKPKEHYNPMFPELFESEKLMFINLVSDKVRFAYDDLGYYNSHTVINCVRVDKLKNVNHPSAKKILKFTDLALAKNYETKFLLGVVNSKLMNWYFFNFQSEGLHFYPNDAKKFPIVKISSRVHQHDLISKVELILSKNNSLKDLIIKFYKFLVAEFPSKKLSTKLLKWHELEFRYFINELNKGIKKKGGVKLTKKDKIEWMELFETKKAEVIILKAEIDKIDRQIDQMVYELYGLTQEEIEIVENATKI